MYSTCIFCQRPLGANEAIEVFPLGRRLAFDEARGRLWVVCRKCGRWNLTPLEERWEAIETCERLFRDTQTRISTDNIGLARVREGLELVRIGEPERPEFAAWRYGDQFVRRRRKALVGLGAVVVGGVWMGGLPWVAFAGAMGLNAVGIGASLLRPRLRIRTEDGRTLKIRLQQLYGVQVQLEPDVNTWSLSLAHSSGRETLQGAEAERVLGLLMPLINPAGGSKREVQEAVDRIEIVGTAGVVGGAWKELSALDDKYLGQTRTSGRVRALTNRFVDVIASGGIRDWPRRRGEIERLPGPTRLAVEMVLHEDQERVALEGELAALESAWREAEEIAAIADNLLAPNEAETRIARHRGSRGDVSED